MLKELKFNHRNFHAAEIGSKCATRRKDKKEIYPGNFFSAVDTETNERILMRCTGTYQQKLSEMMECDALEEGFGSLEDFMKEITAIYGSDYVQSNPEMQVIYFKKA